MDERQPRDEEPVAPADAGVSDEGREEREPVGKDEQSAFAPGGRPDHARSIGEPPPDEG